jgi:hypothetical protein
MKVKGETKLCIKARLDAQRVRYKAVHAEIEESSRDRSIRANELVTKKKEKLFLKDDITRLEKLVKRSEQKSDLENQKSLVLVDEVKTTDGLKDAA